ncbi:unnamed protein product [Blepharisma stoltei]|uniref:FYVE-type domain-containing protein n=1 Tax=Blepharisma stoltei TaxID=1481888 RepID=A0AAU9IIL6_9CILI|nr:unnamed protein product [Blepharisma stoltei]
MTTDRRHSEFAINTELFQKESRPSSAAFSTDQLADQNAYKKDKFCSICGQLFLYGLNQKLTCQVCFRGVCGKCSVQQKSSEESSELVRVCNNCCSKNLQAQVNEQFNSQLIILREEVDALSQKLSIATEETKIESDLKRQVKEHYKKQLEDTTREEMEIKNAMENFKQNNIKLDLQSTQMEKKIERMIEESKNKDLLITAVKEQSEEIQIQIGKNQEQAESLKQTINDQKSENDKIAEEVKRVEEGKANSKDIQIELKNSNEMELALKLSRIREKIDEKKEEISQFYRRLMESRDGEILKQENIGILEKIIEFLEDKKGYKSLESSHIIEQLKNQTYEILQLKSNYLRLKHETERMAEKKEKKKNEAMTSNPCNCAIQ